MRASRQEYTQIRSYGRAGQELAHWITGARVLALLTGALDSGVLAALHARRTPQQVAAATKIDLPGVVDLCRALEAHGVVTRDGDFYQLAPDYALLASPAAPVPLATMLRQTRVMVQALQSVAPAGATYTALSPDDVLAMAEGASISVLSAAPHISPEVIGQALPEVGSCWQAGAHHLEVGCGVGNALLGIVATYPKVTAVGIEIDERTAAEAERRASLLGIADRVELRRMDACELQEQELFDTIEWSQFFFPDASRPVVLAAMRLALKPGGYLFMPWLGSISRDTEPQRGAMVRMALRALRAGGNSFLAFLNDALGDNSGRRKQERRFAALQRLFLQRWGVPVRSVGALAAEVERSGLRVVRSTRTPASHYAFTRGFLLARREAP